MDPGNFAIDLPLAYGFWFVSLDNVFMVHQILLKSMRSIGDMVIRNSELELDKILSRAFMVLTVTG